MQLLYCSPIPTAEFASLSLLLKNEEQGTREELLSVASPFATIPLSTVARCIHELHEYVNSFQKIAETNTPNSPTKPETNSVSDQFLVDDSSCIRENEPVHVFRPSQGHGVALHYAVIKEKNLLQKCAWVILNESKGSARKDSVESVVGVIFCVGISGLSYMHSSSSLVSTMPRRMSDFISVIEGIESFSDTDECQTCIKSILSTAILTDDEERMTNAMADLEAVTLMSDMEGDSPNEKIKSVMSPIGTVRKTKRSQSRRASFKGDSMGASDIKLMVTATSSADMARITAERVAILSVAEKESQLRKYEATGMQRRSSVASALGKTKAVRARRKKVGNEADLEGFDCPSSPESKQKSVLPALSPPGIDTASSQISAAQTRRPPRISPRKPALPTLLAPRNDIANRRAHQQSSRRWTINGPRGGAPPLTHSSSDMSAPREAAFNAFASEAAVNSSFANGSFPNQQFAGLGESKGDTNGNTNHVSNAGRDPWGMIQAAATAEFTMGAYTVGEDEQQRVPRFEFAASSPSDEQRELALSPNVRVGNQRTRDDALNSLQRMLLAAERSEMIGLRDDDETSRGSRSAASFQNGEWLQGMDEELRSAHSELDELVAKVTPADTVAGGMEEPKTRLMINLALNEDLTCSYRQSKMSSCSIEGVVQVSNPLNTG